MARLADDQHQLPVALPCPLPPPHQHGDFLMAADEGRKLTHPGAASAAARPHNEEQVDGFGYAIQLARAPFLRDEEAWDLAQNVCGDERRLPLVKRLDTHGLMRFVISFFFG